LKSAQPWLHAVFPALQVVTPATHELPAVRFSPAVHASPTATRTGGSSVTDAAQLPWSQTSAGRHATWQPPQCAASPARSTQPSAHAVKSGLQMHTASTGSHRPFVPQVSSAWQALPKTPAARIGCTV
jgi:hypothetical protein